MDITKLREPLKISEIDFRIQSINKGKYATILAYKDARADMNRLDEVCGALNWKRIHLNGNANCIVSIYNSEIKEWVGKEDTGSESMSEAKKGLASDSFKRACFNWGIGRELYDYPVISIKLNDDEVQDFNGKFKPSWKLKMKEWVWISEFNEKGKIKALACKDNNGEVRFKFGDFTPKQK